MSEGEKKKREKKTERSAMDRGKVQWQERKSDSTRKRERETERENTLAKRRENAMAIERKARMLYREIGLRERKRAREQVWVE